MIAVCVCVCFFFYFIIFRFHLNWTNGCFIKNTIRFHCFHCTFVWLFLCYDTRDAFTCLYKLTMVGRKREKYENEIIGEIREKCLRGVFVFEFVVVSTLVLRCDWSSDMVDFHRLCVCDSDFFFRKHFAVLIASLGCCVHTVTLFFFLRFNSHCITIPISISFDKRHAKQFNFGIWYAPKTTSTSTIRFYLFYFDFIEKKKKRCGEEQKIEFYVNAPTRNEEETVICYEFFVLISHKIWREVVDVGGRRRRRRRNANTEYAVVHWWDVGCWMWHGKIHYYE